MKLRFVNFVALAVALSVSISSFGETKSKAKGRKFTGEECARMELLAPAAARHMGMRGSSLELINAGKQGDFPEATEALVAWLTGYNNESLLKYPYEMAAEFGKKCVNGTIRAHVKANE